MHNPLLKLHWLLCSDFCALSETNSLQLKYVCQSTIEVCSNLKLSSRDFAVSICVWPIYNLTAEHTIDSQCKSKKGPTKKGYSLPDLK